MSGHTAKVLPGGLWLIVAGLLVLPCLPPSVVAEEPEQTTTLSQLLQQAEQLRREHQWDQALDVLREVVDRRTEDEALAAEAQLMIGEYLFDRGEVTAAQEALIAVPQKFSDQSDWVFRSRLVLIDTYCSQDRLADAEQLAADLLAGSTSAAQEASAQLKLAEVDLKRLRRGPAIVRLREVVQQYQNDEDAAEPRNWARVRLAEVLTHESDFTGADEVCDAVLADYAAGAADHRQAVWALLWKARSRMFTNQLDPLAPAPEPARMAAALSTESGNPDLAYEAHCLLGEIYARLGAAANRLVARGGDAYAASPIPPIVEETRRSQNYVHEGTGGPLMVEAMEHYGQAMHLAEEFSLGRASETMARLQYATHMRHLGMGDKAIATLRMGILDPAQLTDLDRSLAQKIGEFLEASQAEAWHTYLTDPVAYDDPTDAIVQAQYGTEAPLPSSVVTSRWAGLYWQGRFYERQRQDEIALDAYTRSLEEVPHTLARAMTHTRIARTCARLYNQKARQGDKNEADAIRRIGKDSADAAARDWISLLPTLPSNDAHGAIDSAVYAYSDLGYRREGLAVAQQIADLAEREGFNSSTRLFAKYVLMHAWGQNRRHDRAAEVAGEIIDWTTDDPAADVQEIVRQALLHGAHHQAAIGSYAQAHAMLDRVEMEAPQLQGRVSQFRATIVRMEQRAER